MLFIICYKYVLFLFYLLKKHIMKEISNYDILHKAMWNSYCEVKNDNFKMGDLEDEQKLEILEFYLLPYFIEYEEFEICTELKGQINLIKSKQK